MTPTEPPAATGVASLFAGVGCVLFDFDGPLVHLFAERRAKDIAGRLLDGLRVHCPLEDDEFASLDDPHVIVASLQTVLEKRLSPAAARVLVSRTERKLVAEECEAAGSAVATDGAVRLVCGLVRQGRRVAITSNNAGEAISTYLARPDSAELGSAFKGHTYGRSTNPDLMKPDPYCVLQALKGLKWANPDEALLIGDSPTDGAAAKAAGIRFVGFVHPGDTAAGAEAVRKRTDVLYAAGAVVVVSDLNDLSG
jgi:phosphoglycolate phosphatase